MPRKPSTHCSKCGAPRDPKSHYALCIECHRRRCAEEMRKRRGIPLDRPYAVRVHPPGTCVTCGGEVFRQGRCREHYNEYHREHRRKLGMRPMEQYNAERAAAKMTEQERRESEIASQRKRAELYRQRAAEGQRQCKTPNCDGKVETPYGTKCEPCKFVAGYVAPDVRPKAKVKAVQAARVANGTVRRFVAPIPDTPLVIGPEAFQRVKPVDITGHRVTRLAPVGEWGR